MGAKHETNTTSCGNIFAMLSPTKHTILSKYTRPAHIRSLNVNIGSAETIRPASPPAFGFRQKANTAYLAPEKGNGNRAFHWPGLVQKQNGLSHASHVFLEAISMKTLLYSGSETWKIYDLPIRSHMKLRTSAGNYPARYLSGACHCQCKPLTYVWVVSSRQFVPLTELR